MKRQFSIEHRKNISKARKGVKMSENQKKKISETQKGNKYRLGKKCSEESKKRMSKAKLKNPTRYWLGKKRDKKTCKILSEVNKGEKSHFWKGGISFEIYPVDWTKKLKKDIRKRDGYICKTCGISQNELIGRFKVLDVHHIDYDKKNCDPVNLISLCKKCHVKTNGNREYWMRVYKITE